MAVVLLWITLLLPAQNPGDPLPLTVAEASGYERTSSHAEVLAFLDRLRALGAPLRLQTIGTTTEGRPLTLAVLADPPVESVPDPATRDRVVVYVQANIHGGEVDGKEAIQSLLRDLALGDKRPLLENLILLVVPDYNPDGNDRFGPTEEKRRSQPGPAIVGSRHNGQDLDLNRDCMKAESPEFRAVVVEIFDRWDPDVFLDLHTTNGSYHAYPLLDAPHLHPGGPAAPFAYARDVLAPAVRRAMRKRQGLEIFDYGNFDSQANPTRWETYDYKGRMCWNYAGLRGRIGLLSEAYAYATFRGRIEATYHFVEEVLRFLSAHAAEVRTLVRETDARTVAWGNDPGAAPPVALRGRLAPRPAPAMVLMEMTSDPPEGSRRRVRLGLVEGRLLPIYDRFEPDREVPLPAGYLLPPRLETIADHLRLHGIRVDRLDAAWSGEVEAWVPTAVEVREGRWEGGRSFLVDAERRTEMRNVPAGAFVVSTAQPLGILAIHLLEPEAPDSVVAWGLAGLEPSPGEALPYFRVARALPKGE